MGEITIRQAQDRKKIEEKTNTWDKTVVDRRSDLVNWVELFRQFVSRDLKVFAYANNHYSLCRRRHNAASWIMPNPPVSATPFPLHSCHSTHTAA
jgi:hypothetical protein